MVKLILRKRDLQAKLGLSGTAIESLVASGDLKPPILLGPHSKGFVVPEVAAFLAERAARRDASLRPDRPCA